MALNLQVQRALNTTAQPVKDQRGDTSSLTLSTDKVGIGTATPSAKLNIDPKGPGGIVIGDPNTGSGGFTSLLLDISDATNGFARIQAIRSSGSAWGNIALNPLGGSVGIGTATPSAMLNIDPKGPGGIVIGDPNTGSGGFTSLLLDISDATGGFGRVQAIKNSGSAWGDVALNPLGGNVGIRTATPQAALDVNGDIVTNGDIRLTNADCAEDFDVEDAQALEPGTVMVVGDADRLHQSKEAYDKRVAGVLSGAGDYRPGIILGRGQLQNNRLPLALAGKVFCKVDAQYSPVGVGDLLTTSPTPGHAMKADDPLKAFGAVIGKALRPLAEGRGLIPILIALQ